jgi:catalase
MARKIPVTERKAPVTENRNSFTGRERGPVLLQDMHLTEQQEMTL